MIKRAGRRCQMMILNVKSIGIWGEFDSRTPMDILTKLILKYEYLDRRFRFRKASNPLHEDPNITIKSYYPYQLFTSFLLQFALITPHTKIDFQPTVYLMDSW